MQVSRFIICIDLKRSMILNQCLQKVLYGNKNNSTLNINSSKIVLFLRYVAVPDQRNSEPSYIIVSSNTCFDIFLLCDTVFIGLNFCLLFQIEIWLVLTI